LVKRHEINGLLDPDNIANLNLFEVCHDKRVTLFDSGVYSTNIKLALGLSSQGLVK
jgi:hypothetical protein